MSKKLIIPGIILLIIVIIGASVWGGYNSLVEMQTNVDEKSANIQTQLQRRSDLIPNLVNTVKGYAAHEEEVYTAIADARAALASAGSMPEKAEASGALDSAISRLLVVVENYPELKASENFKSLQYELSGTENRVAVARKDYNETAREYNASIRKFPKNILASLFGFEKVDYFEAADGTDKAPAVSFE